MSRNKYLTSVEWLSENHENPDVVIVDCHWDPNAYLRAHIPNAVTSPDTRTLNLRTLRGIQARIYRTLNILKV